MSDNTYSMRDLNDEINFIQTEEEADSKARKLPSWVKCMVCGGRPKLKDYLVEVVPHSSALIHQSCAAGQGKIAGLNVGIEKKGD